MKTLLRDSLVYGSYILFATSSSSHTSYPSGQPPCMYCTTANVRTYVCTVLSILMCVYCVWHYNVCCYSLRVNLDMGKMVYSWMIQRDRAIPGTVVRTSTIPEELGRVEYLLTDKTGTLTQNEMVGSTLILHVCGGQYINVYNTSMKQRDIQIRESLK